MGFYKRHRVWIDQILHALLFGGLAYLHPSIANECASWRRTRSDWTGWIAIRLRGSSQSLQYVKPSTPHDRREGKSDARLDSLR